MKLFRSILAALFCVGLPTAAAAQDKPIVAIYQMDDLANTGQSETFSAMIETAIAQSGKFRVMERSRLNELLKEQGKAKGGLVTSNTPGKIGGFEGVDYLIYGSITGLSVQRKADIGTALLGGLLGNGKGTSNCTSGNVTLGADIKITDANTGEVRYVTRINEVQKAGTACGNQAAQIDATGLLRAAADNVATGLVTAIYPIQIAGVQPDGVIVLNYGQGAVTEGSYMVAFQQGDPIVDPATGEVIATNEFALGVLQIIDVQSRFSKAKAVGGFAQPAEVGAIVRDADEDDLKKFGVKGKRGRR